MQSIEAVKQSIKQRLAVVWDKSEHEVDELIKFDPVVRLLYHAVIFRYEDLFDKQALYKKELMGDLAKRLIPDAHYSASPAFGVLEARPGGKKTIRINTGKVFSTTRNINSTIIPVTFTPISETKLIPAQFALVAGNGVINDVLEKDEEKRITNLSAKNNADERTIWFGLEVPKGEESNFDSLCFFMDYSINKNENILLFHTLAEAQWTLGGKDCSAQKGIDLDELWDGMEETSAWEVAKQRVRDFYRNNFINLKAKKKNQEEFCVPKLSPALQEKYKNLLWVKVSCACAVPIDFFLNNTLSFNAFPVVNCKVNKGSLSPTEPIKAFDLEENEHFFGLLDDGDGNSDLIIRNQRYNSFDAKDLTSELGTIDRLFKQARVLFDTNSYLDESEINIFRSFADVVSDVNLKVQKQGTTAPVNITTKKRLSGTSTYNYLSTFGKWGNSGGTKDVFSYDSPGIDDKSIAALTTFGGGKDPLKEEEMTDRFRYQLLSRNRIVTHEDIRALCYLVFKKINIKKVEINKTTQCGVGKIGLHRVLKVSLTLSEDCSLDKETLAFRQKELLGELESKSVGEWGFVVEVEV